MRRTRHNAVRTGSEKQAASARRFDHSHRKLYFRNQLISVRVIIHWLMIAQPYTPETRAGLPFSPFPPSLPPSLPSPPSPLYRPFALRWVARGDPRATSNWVPRAVAVMRPHRPKCIWQFLIIDNEPDRTTVRSGWKTMRRRLTEKPPPSYPLVHHSASPSPSLPLCSSRVCFSSRASPIIQY